MSPRKGDIRKTGLVTLEGYQAVLTPGKYGYKLAAVVDDAQVEQLEKDRVPLIEWCTSKLKNPKRSLCKPEPWEEVASNKHKIAFSWSEDARPPVVDTEGTPITNSALPLYSGSKVQLAFYQKPYILKDGVTYGTSLKLLGVQVVELGGEAGVSAADHFTSEDVAEIFGNTDGFKVSEFTVVPVEETVDPDDDF